MDKVLTCLVLSAVLSMGALPLISNYSTGEFKSYMDYRYITSTSSEQYKMQQAAYTDSNGLRRYNDYVMGAVSPAYGALGDVLRFTLSSGEQFDIVVGDLKATQDMNTGGTFTKHDGSVVEIIVDTAGRHEWEQLGDMSSVIGYGAVVKIERLRK